MTDTYYYIWFIIDENGVDVPLRKRVESIPDGEVFAAIKRVVGGHGFNASLIKAIDVEKVEVQRTWIPLSRELTVKVKNFVKAELAEIEEILDNFPTVKP